jgi:hypothetical protein
MASLMGGVPEVRALLAGADARGRCALDFLLFRDVVQDHTAELQQVRSCSRPEARHQRPAHYRPAC